MPKNSQSQFDFCNAVKNATERAIADVNRSKHGSIYSRQRMNTAFFAEMGAKLFGTDKMQQPGKDFIPTTTAPANNPMDQAYATGIEIVCKHFGKNQKIKIAPEIFRKYGQQATAFLSLSRPRLVDQGKFQQKTRDEKRIFMKEAALCALADKIRHSRHSIKQADINQNPALECYNPKYATDFGSEIAKRYGNNAAEDILFNELDTTANFVVPVPNILDANGEIISLAYDILSKPSVVTANGIDDRLDLITRDLHYVGFISSHKLGRIRGVKKTNDEKFNFSKDDMLFYRSRVALSMTTVLNGCVTRGTEVIAVPSPDAFARAAHSPEQFRHYYREGIIMAIVDQIVLELCENNIADTNSLKKFLENFDFPIVLMPLNSRAELNKICERISSFESDSPLFSEDIDGTASEFNISTLLTKHKNYSAVKHILKFIMTHLVMVPNEKDAALNFAALGQNLKERGIITKSATSFAELTMGNPVEQFGNGCYGSRANNAKEESDMRCSAFSGEALIDPRYNPFLAQFLLQEKNKALANAKRPYSAPNSTDVIYYVCRAEAKQIGGHDISLIDRNKLDNAIEEEDVMIPQHLLDLVDFTNSGNQSNIHTLDSIKNKGPSAAEQSNYKDRSHDNSSFAPFSGQGVALGGAPTNQEVASSGGVSASSNQESNQGGVPDRVQGDTSGRVPTSGKKPDSDTSTIKASDTTSTIKNDNDESQSDDQGDKKPKRNRTLKYDFNRDFDSEQKNQAYKFDSTTKWRKAFANKIAAKDTTTKVFSPFASRYDSGSCNIVDDLTYALNSMEKSHILDTLQQNKRRANEAKVFFDKDLLSKDDVYAAIYLRSEKDRALNVKYSSVPCVQDLDPSPNQQSRNNVVNNQYKLAHYAVVADIDFVLDSSGKELRTPVSRSLVMQNIPNLADAATSSKFGINQNGSISQSGHILLRDAMSAHYELYIKSCLASLKQEKAVISIVWPRVYAGKLSSSDQAAIYGSALSIALLEVLSNANSANAIKSLVIARPFLAANDNAGHRAWDLAISAIQNKFRINTHILDSGVDVSRVADIVNDFNNKLSGNSGDVLRCFEQHPTVGLEDVGHGWNQEHTSKEASDMLRSGGSLLNIFSGFYNAKLMVKRKYESLAISNSHNLLSHDPLYVMAPRPAPVSTPVATLHAQNPSAQNPIAGSGGAQPSNLPKRPESDLDDFEDRPFPITYVAPYVPEAVYITMPSREALKYVAHNIIKNPVANSYNDGSQASYSAPVAVPHPISSGGAQPSNLPKRPESDLDDFEDRPSGKLTSSQTTLQIPSRNPDGHGSSPHHHKSSVPRHAGHDRDDARCGPVGDYYENDRKTNTNVVKLTKGAGADVAKSVIEANVTVGNKGLGKNPKGNKSHQYQLFNDDAFKSSDYDALLSGLKNRLESFQGYDDDQFEKIKRRRDESKKMAREYKLTIIVGSTVGVALTIISISLGAGRVLPGAAGIAVPISLALAGIIAIISSSVLAKHRLQRNFINAVKSELGLMAGHTPEEGRRLKRTGECTMPPRIDNIFFITVEENSTIAVTRREAPQKDILEYFVCRFKDKNITIFDKDDKTVGVLKPRDQIFIRNSHLKDVILETKWDGNTLIMKAVRDLQQDITQSPSYSETSIQFSGQLPPNSSFKPFTGQGNALGGASSGNLPTTVTKDSNSRRGSDDRGMFA